MLQRVVHHIPPERRARTPHHRVSELARHALGPLMVLRKPGGVSALGPLTPSAWHPTLTLGWLGCAGFCGFWASCDICWNGGGCPLIGWRIDVTGGLAVLLRHYIKPCAGNRKGAMMGEGGSREDSLTGNCAMIDWYCWGASTPESRRKSSSVWRFPRERLIEAASAILLRDRWEGSERKEW